MADLISRSRAAFALERIDGWTSFRWFKDATSILEGLPVQIRLQGLTAVVAQLAAKKSDAERSIAEMIAEWLLRVSPHRPLSSPNGSNGLIGDLLEASVRVSMPRYGAAQVEAIELTEIAKRLAKARDAQRRSMRR